MIYPEGLMHRKINLWLALLIIAILAAIAAWAISVKAARNVSFGGRINLVNPCVLDPESGTCPNCPACTLRLGSACASYTEIQFTPVRGSAYSFICTPKTYSFIRGRTPTPGSWILGNGPQTFPFQSW